MVWGKGVGVTGKLPGDGLVGGEGVSGVGVGSGDGETALVGDASAAF